MYRGKEIIIDDFSGGLASNIATTNHKPNQASDSDNIVILNTGRGFRKRYGNSAFNSSAMNSGANLQGLTYYRQADADEFLFAICGAKAFSSPMSGTMTDRTGAVTITAGANNIWTFFTFNDNLYGFGGPATGPDAPIKWTGSGNASALGGSPPSAYGAFQCNNRAFAFRTSANPSTIYWSIAGNAEDWTGTGSGNSSVWTSDNDMLTSHGILNNNVVLLFKQNSVHQMIVSNLINGAFPIFPLFSGVGCAGKHASVVVEGLCYFISAQARMIVTDGSRILTDRDIPALDDIDDVWDSLNMSRLQYIQGIRYNTADLNWIIWLCSSSAASTNDTAIIWDLGNQCWLKNTTGYRANVMALAQPNTLYAGFYDGKIYTQDVSGTYTDASSSSSSVDAYWTSGWLSNNSFENIKQVRKMNLSFETQSLGQIAVSYGYDFNSFSQTFSISQVSPGGVYDTAIYDQDVYGGQSDLIRNGQNMVGRGNVFQFRIRNQFSIPMKINSLTLSGKAYGQKQIAAR